jgi:hypothetical protein
MQKLAIPLLLPLLALLLLAPWSSNSVSGQGPVDPAAVDLTLAPGESAQVEKTVEVPEAPPKADVYFLADTTGSMDAVISQVQADAATVMSSISASIADVQFGAGNYRDFPGSPSVAFSNDAAVGPDDGVGGAADASDAIATWSASGGGDGSEGQLFALDQIADPADPTGVGFRADASKILVWFGDAPGHDPVCAAISGLGYDITEASATTKLVAAGITVVAISTTSGYPSALDDDPTVSADDYFGTCAIEGSAEQATRIATATGGVHLTGVGASEIASAILSGIAAITFDVAMEVVTEPEACDLDISFDPAIHEDVEGPASVTFTETIVVPEGAASGTYGCTVQARIVGGSVLGEQTVTVTVPTATPSPTPTPTATPTPTPTPVAAAPAGLPETGGGPSEGSSSLPWLVAIVAAIAAMSAGGIWFAYQRRRVR